MDAYDMSTNIVNMFDPDLDVSSRKYKKSVKKQVKTTKKPSGLPEKKPVETPLKLSQITPKTARQIEFFKAYNAGKNVLAHGYAGTGKTFLAIYLALKDLENPDSKFKKIVIIRTAVAGRDMGFLPGTEPEKLAVFERPYISIVNELYGRKAAYDQLKKAGKIEFTSTSFLRGDTIRGAIVIYDEIQNGTWVESDTVVTRLDNDCKLIICGDYMQSDLNKNSDKQAIHKFLEILSKMKTVRRIEFQPEDCVRSGFVRDYLMNRFEYEKNH